MIRIAIPSKGRLHDETTKLLHEADISLLGANHSLFVKANDFPLEALFLSNADIPQTVSDGVADIGIVGLNELKERGGDAEIVRNLGFGHCRLSIILPKEEEYLGVQSLIGKKIATAYPAILREFLNSKGIKAKIHVINDSVSIATNIGLSDAIFDIVNTGTTLIGNHLKEVEVVFPSEAVLIAHKELAQEKRALLEELLFRIDTVKAVEKKKYILLNARNEDLPTIVKILSGIKSPTVMPLAEEGWSSVHTVLDENRFWEVISQLRNAGAQGILALPIEKMIL